MQNLHECTIDGDSASRNGKKKKVKYFTNMILVVNYVEKNKIF